MQTKESAKATQYSATFERKVNEVFTHLEVDQKRALKVIQKEIETRGKKIQAGELLQLRIVRALVFDRLNRNAEAREECLGVLDELKKNDLADHYVLDTFLRTVAQMTDRNIFMQGYIEVVEHLQQKNPNDKELVYYVYESSLQNNRFGVAAKMSSKMVNVFDEPSFALAQIQCLYMDSQKYLGGTGSPISLQFAVAFAEKHMAANQKENVVGAPIPLYFAKLYLKLLVAKKDFEKAITFLTGVGKPSFELWVEEKQWLVRIYLQSDQEEKAIQTLIEMVRLNYENVDEFQSIYFLHELLLSLVVPIVLKHEATPLTIETFSQKLDAATAEPLFKDFSPDFDFLANLFASFKKYQAYNMEDRSVNGHNCRKSAYLSEMLLKHKLLVLGENSLNDEQKSSLFDQVITKYAELFKEVQSLVFDLGPYLQYLTSTSGAQSKFLTEFEALIAVPIDAKRKARVNMNFHKFRQMFGVSYEEDQEELAKKLQALYFELAALDNKPEKGERKIADDVVLLINELYEKKNSAGSDEVTPSLLYRMSLLEHALDQSPYNFDIQMALVKIYDHYGLSISFQSAHANLNLKGVQLESMGYIQFRHSLEFGTVESILKPILTKYTKYWQLNEQDLRRLKLNSLKEDNFDQIENFIEFEGFLQKSYFHHVQAMLNRQYDLVKNSASNPDYGRDFFKNAAGQFSLDFNLQDVSKMTRTQDLKVVQSKFDKPEQAAISQEAIVGVSDNTFTDVINAWIVKNDPQYAQFKNYRQTNFKPHWRNSLGIYDSQVFFSYVQASYAVIDVLTNEADEAASVKAKYDQIEDSQLFAQLKSDLKTDAASALGKNQQDIAEEVITLFTSQIKSIFTASFAFAAIVREEGMPGPQIATAIIETCTEPVTKVIESLKSLEEILLKQSSVRNAHVVQMIIGAVLVPALDVLAGLIKTKGPSFKKKKGAVAKEIETFKTTIWQPMKESIQHLSKSNEKGVKALQDISSDSFNEAKLEAFIQKISLLTVSNDWQLGKISAIVGQKSIEFSKEKEIAVERVVTVTQLVNKQIKGILDTKFKQ